MYFLRAKQTGLTLAELDEIEEGMVVDLIVEAGNDMCADEYRQVADQKDFDNF